MNNNNNNFASVRAAIANAHDVQDLLDITKLIHDKRECGQALFDKNYKGLLTAHTTRGFDRNDLQKLESCCDKLEHIYSTTEQMWRVVDGELNTKIHKICGNDNASIAFFTEHANAELGAIIDDFAQFIWCVQQRIDLVRDDLRQD